MLNSQGLTLEQAPPIRVPLQFFLAAPWFAAAAGLVLVFRGPEVFASRWTPAALALTHLLTIGFLAQTMIGATLQLLPVLAGAPVTAVATVGSTVQILLVAGTLMLAGGFLFPTHWGLVVAAVVLVAGFGLFLTAVGLALTKARGAPDTIRAMGLGLVALVVTLVLGLSLVSGLAGWLPLDDIASTVDMHLTWGLLGWVGLLLSALLFELMPMFYVTPPYPATLRRWFAPFLFLVLVAWSLGLIWSPWAAVAAKALLVMGFLAIALTTWRVTLRRRRPVQDTTLRYVWVGCGTLIAASLIWAVDGGEALVGVLVLGGVCLAFPNGMLYKIVPFLCWFHLQGAVLASGRMDRPMVSMRSFLPDGRTRRQFWLHVAALSSLVAAIRWPEPGARIGGVLLTGAALALFANLGAATRRYRRELRLVRNPGRVSGAEG
jgi:hypothetical protein